MGIDLEQIESENIIPTMFQNDFAREIWEMSYRFSNEPTIDDSFLRTAKALASSEKNPEYWEPIFFNALKDFKFTTGGRILSNAGTGLKGATWLNCFVSGFEKPNADSMKSIHKELGNQMTILKSEGGYGVNASALRPNGAYVAGNGIESPGPVMFMRIWDVSSYVITKGSSKKKKTIQGKNKIRKGAQMLVLDMWHPDITDFIVAKSEKGVLEKFNLSVAVDNNFMNAVENNLPWNLEFPEISHPLYDEEWDGNLKRWKEMSLPTVIYKTYENANELWDFLQKYAYENAEPGILFIDTINKRNNLYYCERIDATNPCAEQGLPHGGVCLLGNINLTQFIDKKTNNWDYAKLKHHIHVAVRMLDNVNDLTNAPLEINKWNLINKRRIGLGIYGLASAFIMMKIKYGSEKSKQMFEELMKFKQNEEYLASVDLAREKGAFPLFSEEFMKSEVMKILPEETVNLIRQYGLRNSHLSCVAPTGNTSGLANYVAGGHEPVFSVATFRTYTIPHFPEGLDLNNPDWKTIPDGKKQIKIINYNGCVYKYSNDRGCMKEECLEDYGIRYLKSIGEFDPSADYIVTTKNLTVDDHMGMHRIATKYVDAAVSKTINLPKGYPFDDYKKLYMQAWKDGIKGITVYVEGSRDAVLSDKSSTEATNIPRHDGVKRPKELECDIHHVSYNKEKWKVIVGKIGEDPYEVFAFRNDKDIIPDGATKGKIIKERKKKYSIVLTGENGAITKITDIGSLFATADQESITRMISLGLRHGADIGYIVDQIQKVDKPLVAFDKVIARTLKKYIKEVPAGKICDACGSNNIILQEGCYLCADCGNSKCS